MFKTNPRTSFAPVSPDESESDDNISLTSSLPDQHDSDHEYEVEGILAEQATEDGKPYYLVEWTGFPLHECTWEPEDNIGDLKAKWEKDKAKHAAGNLEPFDVRKFHEARDRAQEAKAERHRRRNAKRKRLGLPLTPPLPEMDSSEDEAVEDSRVISDPDFIASGLPIHQGIFKGAPNFNRLPNAAHGLPSSITAPVGGSRPQNWPRRPSAASLESVTETPLSTKRNQAAHPPSTGYQGTARKMSKTSTDATSKSKARPANPIPAADPSSVRPTLEVRKPLKAKKSMIQPTGNIFTGGKTRKPRANFKDTMSDPTKEQKFFAKHRYRRIAEKRSRDMEDVAPDVSKMRLLNITNLSNEPSASRRSSGASIQSPVLQTPQEYFPAAGPASMSASTLPNPSVAPLKKKRKSVRFIEDDGEPAILYQEPEPIDIPMEIDSPEPLQRPHPTPAPKKLSLDQNHCIPMAQGGQSSNKRLLLGRASIEATFNGLPRESPLHYAWLADFLDKETLEFQHTCFAGTMGIKINALVQWHLASGTVVSRDGGLALDQVANYLTTRLLGLYYGQTEYNILIYPTKCDEWKAIPLGQEPTSPSEVGLRYFIFTSHQDCKLMLPPLPPLLAEPAVDDSKTKPENTVPSSDRGLMVKRLFGLEYTKLLPGRPRRLPVHKFFLAVPESRGTTTESLCHWLRASIPSCQIYTSHRPGSWDAFQACAEPMPGVVIIHEALAWSLRRFPKLSEYLISRNDEYWCLSEPGHIPLYPSISLPDTESSRDIRLTRLFPYRTAIFLTPSFLVSEPRRAVELLEWFVSRWATGFYYRLVTAWNIHEYLLELADEKYKARQALWDHRGDVQPEIAANLSGLSDEDCKLRYQAANLASEMHIIRTAMAGLYAQDEDSSSLVYADSSIDPNDEQSLVNWFGWWTILRADQYRKFHVVGSSQAIKLHGSRKGERRVRIPKYSKVTLNDPEAVMEVFQERDDHVEEAKPEAHGGDTWPQVSDKGDRKSSHEKRSLSFQSDLVRSTDINSMIAYLDELGFLPGFKSQWVIYRFPVSWLDLEMAEHFNDFTSSYPRIVDWIKFPWPFSRAFNTYVGFFYTIAEEWNTEHLPENRLPERHPWIAIYRPVNPHKKPYGRCEVIIWDPAAKTKFSFNQALAEKDLLFMQRQVIQHVRDHGEQKNPGTWIDQVWLGGFDWPSDCDSPYPLDVTLKFLRRMLGDIKGFLPAPEHIMESRGFRRVALDSGHDKMDISPAPPSSDESPLFVSPNPKPKHPPSEPPSSDGDDEEEEEEEEEDDETTRIIFHPPRGTTPGNSRDPSSSRSKCRNSLYEEARLCRGRAGAAERPSHMTYRFLPTMEWYREQMAEGRGYAHVNVDSWEGVFNMLKIGEGAGGGSGGGEKGGRGGRDGRDGRRESTGESGSVGGHGGGGEERSRRESTGSGV
jgi:chromo domain-containing protein 1